MKRFFILILLFFIRILLYSKQASIGVYGVFNDDEIKMGTVIIFPSDPLKYTPYNLFDNTIKTTIAMNLKYINIYYPDKINNFRVFFYNDIFIDKIVIYNGYQKSKDLYYANERIKELMLYFSGKNFLYSTNVILQDTYNKQIITLIKKIKCDLLYFEIKSVYSGTKYQDVCISEMELWNGNEKYEIVNLEQAKKEYLKKFIKKSKEYLEGGKYCKLKDISYNNIIHLGFNKSDFRFQPDDNTISCYMYFTKNDILFIQEKVAYNLPGVPNWKKVGKKIGTWKIDKKGSIWIKLNNKEWKPSADPRTLEGTDLESYLVADMEDDAQL